MGIRAACWPLSPQYTYSDENNSRLTKPWALPGEASRSRFTTCHQIFLTLHLPHHGRIKPLPVTALRLSSLWLQALHSQKLLLPQRSAVSPVGTLAHLPSSPTNHLNPAASPLPTAPLLTAIITTHFSTVIHSILAGTCSPVFYSQFFLMCSQRPGLPF